jgi:DNA polymerase III subunit beta
MRFTILRETFLKHLRAVGGAVEKRQSQSAPVLANVLIRIQGNRFSLTTTDQEVELLTEGILDETDKLIEGAITVPFRKLMDICRALPEDIELSMHVEAENRVILRAGRSRFALSALSAEQFPKIEALLNTVSLTISQKALKTLIDSTCFAMADQDVRYYLNGMLLEVKNLKGSSVLYAVTADGHRLAERSITLNQHSEGVRVIVPKKGVLELQRALQDIDEELTLHINSNHVCMVTKALTLTCKLLNGRYPDYERLIPKESTHCVQGNREVLKNTFLRAAALFSEKFRGIRLLLSEGYLKILATNAEQDDVEEDVEVKYQGEALEVGFNVKYLIDFLSVIQTEEVSFAFSGPNSSTRIEGVGGETGVYVIMPMRI